MKNGYNENDASTNSLIVLGLKSDPKSPDVKRREGRYRNQLRESCGGTDL